jgi:hypothetical protein
MQTATEPAAFTLALSAEEREMLRHLLERVLRDKQVEDHRTDSITFRELVQRQETLLQNVIDKLGRP